MIDLIKDFRCVIHRTPKEYDEEGREKVFVRFGDDTMYQGLMWRKTPDKYLVYIPKLDKTIEVTVMGFMTGDMLL